MFIIIYPKERRSAYLYKSKKWEMLQPQELKKRIPELERNAWQTFSYVLGNNRGENFIKLGKNSVLSETGPYSVGQLALDSLIS